MTPSINVKAEGQTDTMSCKLQEALHWVTRRKTLFMLATATK